MYNPPRFQATDNEEAFQFMDKHPFATVITVVDGEPFISHLPITAKKVDNKIELIGHLARANPQWKTFSQSKATVLFHGPHTYITPEWYQDGDVPTWNYLALHASGPIELIESQDELIECLKELTAHTERHWPSGWQSYIPEDLVGDALSKSIVGFRIQADKINFKKKLNQNRSAADRFGVMKGLGERKDENSQRVLEAMCEIYDQEGRPYGQD